MRPPPTAWRRHGNGSGLPAAAGSGAARGKMAAGWRRPAAGSAVTLLLSLGASGPALLRGGGGTGGPSAASLRAGEVHRLLTYVFSYDDLISLTCGAVLVWYFAGSFEKNVGTAKHCFLTVLFAVLSALLYLLLEAVVSRVSEVEDPKGFMPVAFAMLGVSTTRSRMKRALFFGVRVPVVLVPWFLLCVAWFIPHSSLLSNICGLLVGEAYGLGYCFCLDIPESVSSKLDRLFPFSLLKRVPGLEYIPGSSAERRASEGIKITPPPGAYPTQSYCSSSPPALPAFPPQHAAARSQAFHHSRAPGRGPAGGHDGARHSSAAGYGLPSSPSRAGGAFGEFYIQTHAGASPGQCCQAGKFSIPQRVCPPGPQAPAGLEPLAGVQQTPGRPAAAAPPVPAEFSRIQVY
ncbi:LOW QUALITY PROTEIN: rhomboid domain-containing protein 2 [Cygnus atratus]|uniref:LOW QUALITY PROTEIN: rhomboid domain-containing protein 2 n=1 Tax=Cygnus atratus TaxID=8868 RepID=UPI0021B8165E|nr:LOW QUALITY PROTEIN: rhomboid domain-containing protein 2 [Cygnus atratus]